jgi:hypothetical protein
MEQMLGCLLFRMREFQEEMKTQFSSLTSKMDAHQERRMFSQEVDGHK